MDVSMSSIATFIGSVVDLLDGTEAGSSCQIRLHSWKEILTDNYRSKSQILP